MASSDTTTVEVTRLEAEYKKDKARVKSNFSRARGNITSLLEDQALPSRRDVLDACRKMDSCSEIATDVLTNFAEFYIRIGEVQKSMRVSNEIEKIDEEYSATYKTAREYLESRQAVIQTKNHAQFVEDSTRSGDAGHSHRRLLQTAGTLRSGYSYASVALERDIMASCAQAAECAGKTDVRKIITG